jgi:hypothetical protein
MSPGQSLLRSSSRVTTSPGRSTSMHRTWNGCACGFTFSPFLRNSPAGLKCEEKTHLIHPIRPR